MKKAVDTTKNQRSIYQFFKPIPSKQGNCRDLDSNFQHEKNSTQHHDENRSGSHQVQIADRADVGVTRSCDDGDDDGNNQQQPTTTPTDSLSEIDKNVEHEFANVPEVVMEPSGTENEQPTKPDVDDGDSQQDEEDKSNSEAIPTDMPEDEEGEEEEEEHQQQPLRPLHPPPPSQHNNSNAYELERLERIRRNMEMMKNLGLGQGGAALLPASIVDAAADDKDNKSNKTTTQAKRTKATSLKRRFVATESQPVRRSRRNKGDTQATDGTKAAARQASPPPSPPPSPLTFDDSDVHRYVCEVVKNSATTPSASSIDTTTTTITNSMERISRLPLLFTTAPPHATSSTNSSLSRVYSIDYNTCTGILVAGGKDGYVAAWGRGTASEDNNNNNDDDATDADGNTLCHPLMTYKLHKGWISDVQLYPDSTTGNSNKLFTAGNDGVVCLWDLHKTATSTAQPQCLLRNDTLHAGGIFSLHANVNDRVVTGSKDWSVVVSCVPPNGGGGFIVERRYEDLHQGVVKCVRWRDTNIFASCGNDRTVKIVDIRVHGDGCDLALAEQHTSTINCVRWSPRDEHLIVSASNDAYMVLHDVRKPDMAVYRFAIGAGGKRVKGIYQPCFVGGGRGVVAAGEPQDVLSLFSVADGRTVSRGEVEIAVGATFSDASGSELFCSGNRCVGVYTIV